jgi:hypothetical protein
LALSSASRFDKSRRYVPRSSLSRSSASRHPAHLLSTIVDRLANSDRTGTDRVRCCASSRQPLVPRAQGPRCRRAGTRLVPDRPGVGSHRRIVWHDRAVFHFLTANEDRRRYVQLAEHTIPSGGTAVMATFASDGPVRCSGLEVRRYDPGQLAQQCGQASNSSRANPTSTPLRAAYTRASSSRPSIA